MDQPIITTTMVTRISLLLFFFFCTCGVITTTGKDTTLINYHVSRHIILIIYLSSRSPGSVLLIYSNNTLKYVHRIIPFLLLISLNNCVIFVVFVFRYVWRDFFFLFIFFCRGLPTFVFNYLYIARLTVRRYVHETNTLGLMSNTFTETQTVAGRHRHAIIFQKKIYLQLNLELWQNRIVHPVRPYVCAPLESSGQHRI